MAFYFLITKALYRLGILEKLNLNFTIKVNSVAAAIPIINGLGVGNLDLTEKWMAELIKRLIQIRSGVFVDVGANIGQTLIKLRAVAPDVDYVGFEPNPTCFHYLTKLVERNN
jgi:hypothetical protein